MGEVYRATDTKLNRSVAIKVLLPAVAKDADRLARFRREAQVLASLNHPNVAAIYGLEESNDVVALALEFVDGEDLAERLTRGALPIDEALPIARQIAEGLEAAHEQGIVHRDLKPANIKITKNGVVKLLDFGLAKALDSDTSSSSARLANSPTMTRGIGMTAHGVILGTAAYMSPEQARGAAVDRRADLWAFGVVLVEMLTGKCPFSGETVSDVLASVLTHEVDLTALPAATPSSIRRLLRRCLEKDRKRRLADAAAARLDVDDALSGARDEPGGPNAVATEARGWRWMASRVVLPTAALTALIVGGLGWMRMRDAPVASQPITLTIVPPPEAQLVQVGAMGSPPLLSPDGSAVMFRTASALYVRRLDSLEVRKVPGSEAFANEPFWHGSTRVTYPAVVAMGRQLLDVRLPDGAPELVMNYSANVRGGGWSDGGTVILGGWGALTVRSGTESVTVKMSDGQPAELLYPEFLPGFEDVLALCDKPEDEREVCVATLSQGTVTKLKALFKNVTAARFTPFGGGRLLFVKSDNLYAQRFNLSARMVEGEPELLVTGVGSQPALRRADFSVANNGTIAWRPGKAALAQLTILDRQGAALGVAGPVGSIDSVYLSPADGTQLLATEDSSDWLLRVGDSGRAPLPRDTHWFGWATDGRRLLGHRDDTLVTRSVDGGAKIEVIGKVPPAVRGLWALSPDGQRVVGRAGVQATWAPVADLTTPGAWTPLVEMEEQQVDASFSPDGRFVLYQSGDDVYVQPVSGPGRRQLIAKDGRDPVWRGDGKEIVFIRPNDGAYSVAVASTDGSPTFGTPTKLFGGIRRAANNVAMSQSLAVSRDGSRFFVVQGVEQPDAGVIHIRTAALR